MGFMRAVIDVTPIAPLLSCTYFCNQSSMKKTTVNTVQPQLTPNQEIIKLRQYLARYGFLFFDNAERILADRRMALASVDVGNGLAYTGTALFRGATLGVYVEWWRAGACANTTDREGREALTYFIAGSPLSGINRCSCVYRDGTTASIEHKGFLDFWQSFAEINRRYASVDRDGAYSLEEVVEALQHG